MDIDAIHSTLLSLTLLPEQLRSAREHLARSEASIQPALTELLGSMERDLRLAKAALARELGFPLCGCCWPPELLATTADGKSHCPATIWRQQPPDCGEAIAETSRSFIASTATYRGRGGDRFVTDRCREGNLSETTGGVL